MSACTALEPRRSLSYRHGSGHLRHRGGISNHRTLSGGGCRQSRGGGQEQAPRLVGTRQ